MASRSQSTYPRAVFLRKGLENLAGGPAGRRVIRDVEVEEFAAIVAEDDDDIAPRATWQNAFVERVIGSIRRECLDHNILSEAHLCGVFRAYSPTENPANLTAVTPNQRHTRIASC
jgi:hypothetical protein